MENQLYLYLQYFNTNNFELYNTVGNYFKLKMSNCQKDCYMKLPVNLYNFVIY